MTTKHTRGPWEARPPRLGAAITIYAGDTPIATTASNTSALTMEMHRRGEVKANARLIAAAPELLEALQWIERHTADFLALDAHEPGGEFEQWVTAARAAIAKATRSAA